MRIFVFVFLGALALTVISTPLFRRLATWLGFVDAPNARKLHQQPMPLMGGLALLLGAFVASLLVLSTLPVRIDTPRVIGTLAASVIVALVGLADDRLQLPPWVKLAGQFVGFLVLFQAGIRIQLGLPEWLNVTLTFLWLAGVSNAVNFLDNMDGLSAGVSAVAASFFLLLATINNQFLVAALAAGLLGACLGFLRYNFKPANIFMGDAGALFLGYFLAILGIQLRFPGQPLSVTWMIPVLILGLPIFDTVLVLVSRLRRRVNPFTTAGKDHLSHRLVRMGFGQREAVLASYLLAAAFGMLALFLTEADVTEAYAISGLTAFTALYALWRLEWRQPRASTGVADDVPPAVVPDKQLPS
ncbi:MAG: MraY family glycosyltransferase [Candidatus Promineifilaceae bacterium]|nr:MraY family glycosyltransferase [Candidatus Promineifilaceae bacterium]